MDWLLWSLAYPLLFSAVNLIDKGILSRSRSALAVFVWLGLGYLAVGLGLSVAYPLQPASPIFYLVAIAGGVANGLAYLFTYKALQREEVSRVTGLIYVSPLITALSASVLLGESLRSGQYIGVGLASLGAILLGFRFSGKVVRARSSLGMLLLAAVSWSVVDLCNKFALGSIGYTTVLAFNLMGVGLVALCVVAVRWDRENLLEPGKLRWAIGASALLNLVGMFALVRATSLAPVSLVVAIGTLQPVIVLVGGLVVGLWFKHRLGEFASSSDELVQRALGILFVSLGVAALVLL